MLKVLGEEVEYIQYSIYNIYMFLFVCLSIDTKYQETKNGKQLWL